MVLGTDLESVGQKGKLKPGSNFLVDGGRRLGGGGRQGEVLEGEEGEVSHAGHSLRLGWGGADNGEPI